MWFSSKAQYAGKGGSPWQVLQRRWGATWGCPLGELVSVHGGVTPCPAPRPTEDSRIMEFDPDCRLCPRLSLFLDQVRTRFPEYHARPVAPFGDANARVLVLGLAPGMHGANASGRPFTGDFAGILLYQTLYQFGFSSSPESISACDGLTLFDCRISNAVKCLPPQNKPLTSEIHTCNIFLQRELSRLPPGAVVVALGTVAHDAVLRALGLKRSCYRFAHDRLHELNPNLRLVDSYHCSRYNTQTNRLTPEMFQKVFRRVRALLAEK